MAVTSLVVDTPCGFIPMKHYLKAYTEDGEDTSPSPMTDHEFRAFMASHVIVEDQPAPLQGKVAEALIADAFRAFDKVRRGSLDAERSAVRPPLSALFVGFHFRCWSLVHAVKLRPMGGEMSRRVLSMEVC